MTSARRRCPPRARLYRSCIHRTATRIEIAVAANAKKSIASTERGMPTSFPRLASSTTNATELVAVVASRRTRSLTLTCRHDPRWTPNPMTASTRRQTSSGSAARKRSASDAGRSKSNRSSKATLNAIAATAACSAIEIWNRRRASVVRNDVDMEGGRAKTEAGRSHTRGFHKQAVHWPCAPTDARGISVRSCHSMACAATADERPGRGVGKVSAAADRRVRTRDTCVRRTFAGPGCSSRPCQCVAAEPSGQAAAVKCSEPVRASLAPGRGTSARANR